MPDIRLEGCRSRPLVGYLKGLGLLRIVAQQVDADAAARWVGGTLELRSDLDDDGLRGFLLDGYSPTPAVSPWNGGSGFFPNDRTEALEQIEASSDPRFSDYGAAVRLSREVLAHLGLEEKPDSVAKTRLLKRLRRELPDRAVDWLDAAVVLTGTQLAYPPLLGSGGNDGRYDFSNNYAHAVVEVLEAAGREQSMELLRAALDGDSAPLKRKLSLAHFFRDASPVNSPLGESDSLGNPWDLALAVEGSLLLLPGSARRHGSQLAADLVAPFTARPTAANYGSAVAGESGRAELWLPIWSGWTTVRELEGLMREARAQVGRRYAASGLDFVRASGELGVARGVDAFERYAVVERAGQANLAVTAGQIEVRPRPAAAAIRTLDPWLRKLLAFARRDTCPRAPAQAIRRLEQNLFTFAATGAKQDGTAVLEGLGEVEHTLSRSARAATDAGIRPLGGVPAGPWVEATDDGSSEYAVGAAIASLRDQHPTLPAVRDYLHGTAVEDRWRAFDPDRAQAVTRSPDPVRLLASLHARRHLDASRMQLVAEPSAAEGPERRLGYQWGAPCPMHAAHALVTGSLDDSRMLRLLDGLCLLDWHRAPLPQATAYEPELPAPAFDLLALVWHDAPERRLGPRPGWAARLAAGSVAPVLRDATVRMAQALLRPLVGVQDLTAGRLDGPRLAAALLPSLSRADLARIAWRLAEFEGPPEARAVGEDNDSELEPHMEEAR